MKAKVYDNMEWSERQETFQVCVDKKVHLSIDRHIGKGKYETCSIRYYKFCPCNGECERAGLIKLPEEIEQMVHSCLEDGNWDEKSVEKVEDISSLWFEWL